MKGKTAAYSLVAMLNCPNCGCELACEVDAVNRRKQLLRFKCPNDDCGSTVTISNPLYETVYYETVYQPRVTRKRRTFMFDQTQSEPKFTPEIPRPFLYKKKPGATYARQKNKTGAFFIMQEKNKRW